MATASTVGTGILSSTDGAIPTAALPAVRVLVLAARSFFAELAAAAFASVMSSRSGSHAGTAAVGLTGSAGLTRALSWLSP